MAPVDVLGLEVGYRLIPLVDRSQDGELLKRIRGLRKKFAQEVGFLSAPVHIRDNLELKPNAYRIALKGVEVGSGEAYPGMFLAINPGRVSGTLPGTPTKDPAFGLPAVWIDAALRDQAHVLGYTVVDASTVVATHLNHLILSHAAELLGRQETQQLLDHIAKDAPKLVEDLVPKLLPLATCAARVAEPAGRRRQHSRHAHHHRRAGRTCAAHPGSARTHGAGARRAGSRDRPAALSRAAPKCRSWRSNPDWSACLARPCRAPAATVRASSRAWPIRCCARPPPPSQRQEELGLPAVLLVPGQLRWLLSRFLRRAWPALKVLANAEVPESRTIKVTTVIGAKT